MKPWENPSFNEVPTLHSSHRQTNLNPKIPRPKIFSETFFHDGRSNTRICPLQQHNNKSAILIGRGIQKFCRFCRGANEGLETCLTTTQPQVPRRATSSRRRFTWGYYLPAVMGLS
ncbi:MAG: hypothetical protein HZA50_10870 [Planctomycetes bacterium]|nr:hypothetical protein [Planctomycetota bacterium]